MKLAFVLALGVSAALLPLSARAAQGQGNQPPVCVISGGDVTVTASGPLVVIPLSGCESSDPDAGQTLAFEWYSCPGAQLTSSDLCATELVIDVTQVALPFQCGVRLIVRDGQGPDSYSLCRIWVNVLPPEQPDLDVRPGCCPNKVYTEKGGSLPVALVATPGFDVADVDTKSLRLERVDGIGSEVAPWLAFPWDTATPFQGDGCDCHKLTNDGLPDLYLKFSNCKLVKAFDLGKEKDKASVPLVLRGKLKNGQAFEAFDCIRVEKGCK